MAHTLTSTLLLAGAVVAAACTSRRLVPETPVQAQDGGVRVSVDSGAWHGASSVPLELTPVQLTVRNGTGQDIYFSRSDVALIGAKQKLSALSPDRIEPHPMRTTLGIEPTSPLAPPPIPPAPINDLAIEQGSGQEVLPPGAFQGFTYREPMLPYSESLGDPAQQEIRDAALWDGRIPAGESAAGFVYFERLPEVDRLDLHVTLRKAPNGAPVSTLIIPYGVQR